MVTRLSRPKEDLKAELREQLLLLRHACESYDRGFEAIAKHIAISLRVLLHHRGQSRALLDQLGLRQGRFFDSAGPLSSGNLLPECNLVGGQMDASGARYMPMVRLGGGPTPPKLVPFVEWWNSPVLKDNRQNRFSRRELVLNVADADGGGHVDPTLDQAYLNISRQNGLGWVFTRGNFEAAFAGRAELACMRQIAHELLLTLHRQGGEFAAHAQPILPASDNAA
jgi:hypothetical protein